MSQNGIESTLSASNLPDEQLQPSVQRAWTTGILGTGIGASGLITADIDHDGTVEIIAGGSTSTFGGNSFWYVLKPNATGGYTQSWISGLYTSSISQISAIDTDGDGISSIFLGLGDGSIVVYDGKTLEQTTLLGPTGSAINQIIFADADNDSVDDIVVVNNNNLFIYDASSLTLKHQLNYGAGDVRVGNVDGDAANEIVLSSGQVIQLNGTTATVEWTYAGGEFGSSIALSDVDGDGIQEIIGASAWYYITAFDADLQSPKWQINTRQDIGTLQVADIDGDGVDEILYGDGQWGSIHAYDVKTLTEERTINNPEHGVTNIAISDLDGDGTLEIVWGSGATSTGPDYLYISDLATGTQEWQSSHLDGPFNAIDVDDIDNDGTQELVFASSRSNSSYGDGIVSIVDSTTHTSEWQSQSNFFGGTTWTGIHDVELGDVNGDGVKEIVVATDRLYDGAIYVLDGQTKQIQNSYFYDQGAPMQSLAIADVDNDGTNEIIAGGSRAHTGAPGVYTYILDARTGAVEWKSINLGGYWSSISEIEVGNIDNDEAQEIVAINNSLFVFDGKTHQQWQSSFSGVTSAHLHDLTLDGKQEILAGTNSGQVLVVEGQTFQTQQSLQLGSSPITGLQTYDFDEDGTVELVYTDSTSVGIYSLKHSMTLWKSEVLGASVGNNNSLMVANTDADGKVEILVGTNYTVVEFEVGQLSNPPAIAQPIPNAITNNGSEFTLDISTSFQDPDVDDDLLYSAVGLPSGLVLNPNTGIIQGTATSAGAYTVTVTATDTAGLSVSDSFELTVFNLIRLTPGKDTTIGTTAPDEIEGLAGHDLLYGNQGNDWIKGGNGKDRLFGGSGNDLLNGDAGNDDLNGGIGQDTLDGGTGVDQLTGGAGSDVFVLRSSSGIEKILDFKNGVDRLGLANGLTYEDLIITQEGSRTTISDVNGVIAKLWRVNVSLITEVDFVAV
ncbi:MULTISPECIES: FG-GAP-like repeat-containing protein [unclassified Leptolyngbya]|uniref:FG-GAP-like repeat-containing protein n=1 Tax=unclassified Leptolyngbya TaxID=2650499 RepID=UPI0016835145|nr:MULTISPECIES: FG-GAP-like repeat-containing protein [unclassified Leptolyngbya]MBD1909986.1 putative Ig domain-containing protein [Leptolyngbya sp. FACHB-8]MBD2152927.1 putative Ig domain-containing protein [Leptolyngbya sp. FACHB-16]